MAEVALTIGGNEYHVACADGEEAHLRNMAAMIDTRVVQVEQSVGQMNATRQLLYASLWLADEVNSAAPQPAAAATTADTAVHEAALTRLAERLEALASALEA